MHWSECFADRGDSTCKGPVAGSGSKELEQESWGEGGA